MSVFAVIITCNKSKQKWQKEEKLTNLKERWHEEDIIQTIQQ